MACVHVVPKADITHALWSRILLVWHYWCKQPLNSPKVSDVQVVSCKWKTKMKCINRKEMLLLYVLIWNTMFGKHIIFKILKGKLHFYHIAKKKKKKTWFHKKFVDQTNHWNPKYGRGLGRRQASRRSWLVTSRGRRLHAACRRNRSARSLSRSHSYPARSYKLKSPLRSCVKILSRRNVIKSSLRHTC